MKLEMPVEKVINTAYLYAKVFKKKVKPSLKKLALAELGRTVQEGTHDPLEDARIAMRIYHKRAALWEKLRAAGVMAAAAHSKQNPVDSMPAALRKEYLQVLNRAWANMPDAQRAPRKRGPYCPECDEYGHETSAECLGLYFGHGSYIGEIGDGFMPDCDPAFWGFGY